MTMFGNVMNKAQIIAARAAGKLQISSFDPEKLRNVHYPLTAEKILHKSAESPDGSYRFTVVKDFSVEPAPYVFAPNEFALIEIEEHIAISEHIVGHFIPSSDTINKGLAFVAGRIEAPFGNFNRRKQMVRFGVKNLTDRPVRLTGEERVGHVYFIDLRGLDNLGLPVTEEEQRRYEQWTRRRIRADSDGPDYGTGE